jgi:heme-degrading monooxygenase HmoA
LICVLWRFKVRDDKRTEFERIYSSGGAWSQLFRRDSAYRDTLLLRDVSAGNSYLCIDRWANLESYERFKTRHADEYKRLDRECESLTEEEFPLGIFEEL